MSGLSASISCSGGLLPSYVTPACGFRVPFREGDFAPVLRGLGTRLCADKPFDFKMYQVFLLGRPIKG